MRRIWHLVFGHGSSGLDYYEFPRWMNRAQLGLYECQRCGLVASYRYPMTTAEVPVRWQEYRQPCGHGLNWSEEMTEWTHQSTQDPDTASLVKAGEPWFWVPAKQACQRVDWLNDH